MESAYQRAINSASSAFITSILFSIAQYVKSNLQEISSLPVEEVANRFRTQIGVPATAGVHQGMSTIAPALTGGAMPGFNLTGGSYVPPAAKSRKTGTGKQAAIQSQRHVPLEQYVEDYKEGKQVCAYMPNRGEKKHLVCGGPASNVMQFPQEPLKWRCQACTSKGGEIDKKMLSYKGSTGSHVEGYNTPAPPAAISRSGVPLPATGDKSVPLPAIFNTGPPTLAGLQSGLLAQSQIQSSVGGILGSLGASRPPSQPKLPGILGNIGGSLGQTSVLGAMGSMPQALKQPGLGLGSGPSSFPMQQAPALTQGSFPMQQAPALTQGSFPMQQAPALTQGSFPMQQAPALTQGSFPMQQAPALSQSSFSLQPPQSRLPQLSSLMPQQSQGLKSLGSLDLSQLPGITETKSVITQAPSQFRAFRNPHMSGVAFPKTDHKSLVIQETDAGLTCLGKVTGFVPDESSVPPVDWLQKLTTPNDEEMEYLKLNDIAYTPLAQVEGEKIES